MIASELLVKCVRLSVGLDAQCVMQTARSTQIAVLVVCKEETEADFVRLQRADGDDGLYARQLLRRTSGQDTDAGRRHSTTQLAASSNPPYHPMVAPLVMNVRETQREQCGSG